MELSLAFIYVLCSFIFKGAIWGCYIHFWTKLIIYTHWFLKNITKGAPRWCSSLRRCITVHNRPLYRSPVTRGRCCFNFLYLVMSILLDWQYESAEILLFFSQEFSLHSEYKHIALRQPWFIQHIHSIPPCNFQGENIAPHFLSSSLFSPTRSPPCPHTAQTFHF
jgi:hypothetical protein